ncbi:MAG: hypothetical protein ACTSUT_02310 [Promethearchaeota archaeon]
MKKSVDKIRAGGTLCPFPANWRSESPLPPTCSIVISFRSRRKD